MLIRPVAPIISSEPWQVEAACAEVGPAPWDTTGDALNNLNRAAIAICGRCPVRSECLELAMRTETGGKQYRSNIFGGRTPAQRAALAAKRATQASSLPLCRDCERPLRPHHTRAADWPGTTVRWAADQCETCAMREKRRGKVA